MPMLEQNKHSRALNQLRQARRALVDIGFVLDADVCYDGSSIVIRCNSHAGAIRRMTDARAGLETLTVILGELIEPIPAPAAALARAETPEEG